MERFLVFAGALGFTYDDFTSARRVHAGAVVRAVDPRLAAERAGLKPGDLVTELGGTPVRDAADLQIRLALLRTGEIAGLAHDPRRCPGTPWLNVPSQRKRRPLQENGAAGRRRHVAGATAGGVFANAASSH